MHDELWAGVRLKLEHAGFYLEKMGASLAPPERTHHNVVLESAGAILDTGWQRAFYAYFDAYLVATRSVPEIIQACFGEDRGSPPMRRWFDGLPADEQTRRRAFTAQFAGEHAKFRAHQLSAVRNMIVHRTGVSGIEVRTTGFFGVTYVGNSITPMPGSEVRPIEPRNDPVAQAMAAMQRPIPIRPVANDFQIDGKLLFPLCHEYLQSADQLVTAAATISETVHDAKMLSGPLS